jgi:hypothetical protein
MIRLLQTLNKYRAFKKAILSEAPDDAGGPCRGWFQLLIFSIDEEPNFQAALEKMDDSVGMELVLMDIGAYKDTSLDDQALDRMEKIIRFLRDRGKDIILRVAYDHDGKGMEREPSFFNQVLEHARQVAGFVRDHSKDIFIYQGLLVGRWGEMHTSRFAVEDRLRDIFNVFETELKGKVFMAVRRPVQWRYLRLQPDEGKSTNVDGLGIFNDGMFGSDSDLGTYDSANASTEVWRKPWNRQNEIAFTGGISAFTPCGGEALFGQGFVTVNPDSVFVDQLKSQGITYLNRFHDKKLLEHWENITFNGKGIWNGRSVLDYVAAHLGYRFFIKNAEAVKSRNGCEITITVENQGFANIYNDTEICIEYEGITGRQTEAFKEKLNTCRAGKEKTFSVRIEPEEGSVYVYAKELLSGEKIRFANDNMTADGKCFIGEINI